MLVFHGPSLIICVLGAQRTYTFCLILFMQIFRQRWLLRLTVLLLSISLHLIWNKTPVELNFGIQVFIYRLWWKIQFSSFPLSIIFFYLFSVFSFYLMGKKRAVLQLSQTTFHDWPNQTALVRLISDLLESREDEWCSIDHHSKYQNNNFILIVKLPGAKWITT